MKITRKIFQPGTRGYALLIVLIFVGVALLLLGSVMDWSNSNARQTERNNLFGASEGAAECATESVIAKMTADFFKNYFVTTPTNFYMTNSLSCIPATNGWPIQFTFSNPLNSSYPTYVSILPINWTTNWSTLFSSNYNGMHAYVVTCTAISTATTVNQPYTVSATVQQTFQLASIPITQNMAFYYINMEVDPGQAMTLGGPVFCNQSIWARGLSTFGSTVQAVGVVSTNSANPWLLTKTDATAPTFSQNPVTNATSLVMPIGTTNDPIAVRALLGLPPAGTSPYSPTGQVYFANQASLIVSNSPSGKISAFIQDSNNVINMTPIPYDVMIVTNLGATKYTNWTYSFATNTTFYDYREGKTVNAVQLNVGALATWITNSSGSTFNTQLVNDTGLPIDSVYVYNNAPSSSSSLPSVRLANGGTLPYDNGRGLTVVTPDPLYVLGNYNANGSSLNNGTNVVNALPAMLIGDSITALSTTWSDTYNSGTALGSRNPGATTINAATMEGIVPTAGANYSGGLENFIRLLENWTGQTLTYNGSVIVMFPSQYATNHWIAPGTYYNAPTRAWAFDVNFLKQSGIPPIAPRLTVLQRSGWSVY